MADKITELEHARKKRRVKIGVRRAMLVVGMIAAIAGIIFGINAMWQSAFIEKISRSIASMGRGNGYPIVTEGNAIRDIYNFGSDVVVLTDSSLQVYNKTARCLQDAHHGISNPVAELSDVRILLYEPNGKKISIYNSSRKIVEKSFDHSISTAAISDKGVYAVATHGGRDASTVYIYNKSGDLVFTWYSEERVSDLAVSPDGKTVTASTLVTENGVLVTKLYYFNTSLKKQVAEYSIPGEMAVEMQYRDDNRLCLITDKSASLLTDRGKLEKSYEYDGRTLGGCSMENGENIVLMLGDYKDYRKTEFTVLDSQFAEKASINLNADVIDFKSGNLLSILTEHGVYEYSYDGQLNSSAKISLGRQIACGNGYVYICTSNGIEKVNTNKGDVISQE